MLDAQGGSGRKRAPGPTRPGTATTAGWSTRRGVGMGDPISGLPASNTTEDRLSSRETAGLGASGKRIGLAVSADVRPCEACRGTSRVYSSQRGAGLSALSAGAAARSTTGHPNRLIGTPTTRRLTSTWSPQPAESRKPRTAAQLFETGAASRVGLIPPVSRGVATSFEWGRVGVSGVASLVHRLLPTPRAVWVRGRAPASKRGAPAPSRIRWQLPRMAREAGTPHLLGGGSASSAPGVARMSK